MKVLLVDDEKDILLLIGRNIERWGYQLHTAENSSQALTLLREKNPDVIILDYLMPNVDGLETLREIRKTNQNVRVIMFTAFPDERSIEGSEELGVSAYVPKLSPFVDTQKALKTALRVIEGNISHNSVTSD